MQTIAFLNRKGGVGKTSSCHHIAGALAEAGRRVLLVDNDPQASLTKGLMGPAEAEALDPAGTIAAIYAGDPRPIAALARRTGFQGIDLVAGSALLDEANVAEPEAAPPAEARRLADALAEAAGYDLALVDCPPNLLGCSWAALLAADAMVIPLQPEDYGAQGLAAVRDFAGRARAVNPRLALAGYLITMIDRRKTLHRMYEGELRTTYAGDVFSATLPDLVAFAEAITRRRPVTSHERAGKAAVSARLVAAELLARVAPARSRRRAAAGKGVA